MSDSPTLQDRILAFHDACTAAGQDSSEIIQEWSGNAPIVEPIGNVYIFPCKRYPTGYVLSDRELEILLVFMEVVHPELFSEKEKTTHA